jgi:hypothetical protein
MKYIPVIFLITLAVICSSCQESKTIRHTPTPAPTAISTPTPTATPIPTPTPTPEFITANADSCSGILYASMILGSRVNELAYQLYNGASETITITKVEFYNGEGTIEHSIAEADIIAEWGSNQVAPFNSFSGSLSFGITPTEEDVATWYIVWSCTSESGNPFSVEVYYHNPSS